MTTTDKLIQAARDEFATKGYNGTHTNAIARAAGFAPQTFYRHFDDKLTIFVAVYERWQLEEAAFLRDMLSEQRPASDIAERIVYHHRQNKQFRRDLRFLAIEDDLVRSARRDSRTRQLEFVGGTDRAGQAARLLEIERLADAIAEDEFVDLGLDDTAAKEEIVRRINEMLSAA